MSKVLGSCHCGAIKYEVILDKEIGLIKCNCTICHKFNFIGQRVKPENFTLLQGKDNVQDYQFHLKRVHHYFCKTCGTHAYAPGKVEELGGDFIWVNSNCLETDLTGFKVTGLNGKSETWETTHTYTL